MHRKSIIAVSHTSRREKSNVATSRDRESVELTHPFKSDSYNRVEQKSPYSLKQATVGVKGGENEIYGKELKEMERG